MVKNSTVYKVAMQCTNIKFTSTSYSTCELVKKGKVISIKVTTVYVIRFSSLQ